LKKLTLILLLSTLFGCGGNVATKKFRIAEEPTPDKALVYFYRNFNTVSNGTPTIFINKNEITDLPPVSYNFTYLAPGSYKVEARIVDAFSNYVVAGANIKVVGGETYYIKYSVTRDSSAANGNIYGGPMIDIFMGYKDTPDTLELVKPDIAKRYIVNNKLAEKIKN